MSGFTLLEILVLAWTWLTALALVIWIGIIAAESFIYNDAEPHAVLWLSVSRRRSCPLQWICLLTVLIGEIIILVIHVAQNAQAQQSSIFNSIVLNKTFLQSDYGFLWFVQIALMLALQVVYWWFTYQDHQIDGTRKLTHRSFLIITLVCAALLLLPYTLIEEATRSTAQFHIYALILNWASFVAQCGWFGVFIYLTYILLPLLPTIELADRAGVLFYCLRRVSRLILVFSIMLCACELYISQLGLSSIQQFSTDSYGHALFIQWVVIIVMVIFEVYAFFVLYPKLNKIVAIRANRALVVQDNRQIALDGITQRLRVVFNIQPWLGGGVLFCTVLMTFFVTPGAFLATNTSQSSAPGTILTATPPDTLSTQTKGVGNLLVTLIVSPAQTNVVNTITVKLTDRRNGEPVTSAHIEISTDMEVMDMGTVRAAMTADGLVYRATFQPYVTFSMSGVWDLTLTLQVAGQAPQKVVFAVLFLSGT